MSQANTLDVASAARVYVTDWGDCLRVDLNQLGARLGPEPAGGRNAWSHEQNVRLCDHMAAALAPHGGDLNSIAEWTVAVNRHYDLQDMRRERTSRWRPGFGSAITTLPWANPASDRSVTIQNVAYVPKPGRAPITVRAWQPACIYDCSFLGLATATVADVGAARMIYLSGVVAWDKAIQPIHGDNPRAQMRCVLQLMQDAFVEAGGSPADVVRLRPFAANPAVGRIIREECENLWTSRGHPAPVVLLAEESSFWDSPGLFTEIQAMGVAAGTGRKVSQEECRIPSLTDAMTRVRRTGTDSWDMYHIGELRAPPGTLAKDEAAAIGRQVAAVRQALDLAAGDVCLAFGYVSDASVLAALDAELGRHCSASAVHLVHCPVMPELGGRTVKLELTARKLQP